MKHSLINSRAIDSDEAVAVCNRGLRPVPNSDGASEIVRVKRVKREKPLLAGRPFLR